VGRTEGTIASTVEVEIAVGGILVGTGVDVDSMAVPAVAVQALRNRKETMMKFFI
jgi:hypothetical protein